MKTKLNISMLVILITAGFAMAQVPTVQDKQKVRTVTVPISIFTKEELQSNQIEEYVHAERLIVKEDNDEQTVLSIRSVANSPLSLAILIEEDLTSNFNLQIPELAEFIRELPKGTRVLLGYIRGGSVVVRQKFTEDLEKASKSLHIVSGSSVTSGNGPYDGVSDVLGRFDSLPAGRRAVLVISDGLDSSQGLTGFSSFQSPSLDRAIVKAQKKSVALYSFYSPTALTDTANGAVIASAQAGLQRMSEETGGKAFFLGTGAPISFSPFFRDITKLINRQFALTYLSTHMKKGYHTLRISSTNQNVKIQHPNGYYYR
jgi:VWFA-related protein